MNPVELSMCEQWINGPKVIERTEPKFGAMLEKCSEVMWTRVSHKLLVNSNPTSIGNIVQCQNFSSLERLLTITAYVLKFVELLRSKLKKSPRAVSSEVTLKDTEKAHTIWMRCPCCDKDGVWRCWGRLSHANISVSTRHPILLNKRHHLATLLVRD